MARKKEEEYDLVVRVKGRHHLVVDSAARRLIGVAQGFNKRVHGPRNLRRTYGELYIPAADPLAPPTVYPDENIYRSSIVIEHPDSKLVDELSRTPIPGDVALSFKVFAGSERPSQRIAEGVKED